jgi:hypothetical protein
VSDSRGGKEVRFDSEPEANQGARAELATDRKPALSIPPKPTRRSSSASFSLPSSRCCSLLRIALALYPQTKEKIDELITFVQTSGSHLPRIAFRLVEAQAAVTKVPCASGEFTGK